MKSTLFTLGLAAAIVCPAFSQEIKPAYEVVSRVTPQALKQVEFQLDKSIDGFSLENKKGKLLIKAPCVNNLTAGYGYFLREYQNAHFSWNGDRLPETINPALVKAPIQVKQPWKWRYAYNYCTLSYSSAFWGVKQWERELDYMALNGINVALVQAGLEKVWQLTLTELGYPEDKIRAFIPNPAAAAWWNMGNLEGHGGPISQDMIEQEARLGGFITKRMKELGMSPVLQGFIGLVPNGLKEHYKTDGAQYISQGGWAGGFARPDFLVPTTEAYQKMAAIWYANIEKVYGMKGSFFGGDLFHEGGNSAGVDVTKASSAVQSAMQKGSPGSTWVLQAWGGNPSGALLDGLKKENTLVLYLNNDTVDGALGKNRQGYKGMPWIWCEVINFGGKHHLFGSLKQMAELGTLQDSPDKDNLQGLGMMSEGSGTNPICYEIFFQRLWMPKGTIMTKDELAGWMATYAKKRYGTAPKLIVEGLEKLERSVYSPEKGMGDGVESILCARPGRNVQKACTWAPSNMYYNTADVVAAAQDYMKAALASPELLKQETFRYDLIDIIRQVTADQARPLLAAAMLAYDAGDKKEFAKRSSQFLDMMTDLDNLLATHKQWRFGAIYEDAQAKGKTKAEIENMEIAAKRLVTTWTGKIDELNDYAHRQLSGLMEDYYKPRWVLFFDTYKQALEGKIKSNEIDHKFLTAVHKIEVDWEKEGTAYTSKPAGDLMKNAAQMVKKYGDMAKELADFSAEIKGVKWSLRDGAKQFDFDVSDQITSPGTYTATFQWENGSSALEISKVALYEGNKLISEDVHAGQAGMENKANVYTIEVSKLRTNLAAYIIKAEVKGVSGTDSGGKFIFRKMK